MKALTTAGLTKLIQLIKSSFISVNETVTTQTITLADVATSGDYDDLTNKPTIGNGTITFTQGGVTKGTITTNQSGNATIALDAGGGGGTATDVQINGISITSNNVADIITEGVYNETTNKIATIADIPPIPTLEGVAPIEVSDAPPTVAPSDYISYSDGTVSSNWSELTSPHQGEDFYIDIVIPADVNINALNDYWYIGNKDNAQQLGFRYYDISQYYENYIFYEIFDDNNNKISRLWYGSKDFRAGNDTSVPTMSTDGSIDGVYVFGVYHNAGETTSYLINSSESADNNVSNGLTITNSRLNKIRLYYNPRNLGNGYAVDNSYIWSGICDKSQIGGYGSLQETAILNSLKLYTSPTDTTGIELIREGIADGYSIKLNIGEGLAVDNNNLISLGYTKTETDSLLNGKQDVLTAGDGISISGGTTALPNDFTGDSPLITCDSTESGYPAYYAFDGDNSTYWGGVNTGEHWITRQHNSIVVKSVSVSFREYAERFTQGEIQGSNDGTTFTTIASFSNNEDTSITINCSANTTAYTYTRLVGTTTSSGWGKVAEMVISYETPSVISVNSTIVRQETADTITLYAWYSQLLDLTVYTTIENITTSDYGKPIYDTNMNVIGRITNYNGTNITARVVSLNTLEDFARLSTSDTTFTRKTLTDYSGNNLNITQADGQPVQSFIKLMSSSGTKNGVQLDLSSYLPNDGYNYDVKFLLRGYDDDSSYYYRIETDIFDDGDTTTGNSEYLQLQGGTNSRQNINIFDLPVGTGRYIKVYGSGADNIYIFALGYRRIGTNS